MSESKCFTQSGIIMKIIIASTILKYEVQLSTL